MHTYTHMYTYTHMHISTCTHYSRNFLCSVPAELCSLQLHSLDLSNNRLVSLPMELGSLQQLRHLVRLPCFEASCHVPRTHALVPGLVPWSQDTCPGRRPHALVPGHMPWSQDTCAVLKLFTYIIPKLEECLKSLAC